MGYPLAHGAGNAFAGDAFWASHGMAPESFPHWFFHFVFAATAATIVSGAMAERCEFVSYICYSFSITGAFRIRCCRVLYSSEQSWETKKSHTFAINVFHTSALQEQMRTQVSLFFPGIVYPVVTHWAWAPEGWLYQGINIDHDGESVPIAYRVRLTAHFAGAHMEKCQCNSLNKILFCHAPKATAFTWGHLTENSTPGLYKFV